MSKIDESAIRLAASLCIAVGETIRELREVPSGHLYASLMTRGCSLSTYQAVIQTLKNAGLVEERVNVLRWIGPLPS